MTSGAGVSGVGSVGAGSVPKLGDIGRRFSLAAPFIGSSKHNTSVVASVDTPAEDDDDHAVTFNEPTAHEDSWEATENSILYAPTPPVPVYIGVVSAENLPSGTDITCTILFNEYTVQAITATSTQDNYMSAKVEFYTAPVVCYIPPGLPLSACTLSITLTRLDTHNKAVVLSTLHLRGSALVMFVRKGKQYIDMKRTPLHTNTNPALHDNTHTNSNTADSNLKACKLNVIASYTPIVQEKYELHILSARNLPKADVFGSR